MRNRSEIFYKSPFAKNVPQLKMYLKFEVLCSLCGVCLRTENHFRIINIFDIMDMLIRVFLLFFNRSINTIMHRYYALITGIQRILYSSSISLSLSLSLPLCMYVCVCECEGCPENKKSYDENNRKGLKICSIKIKTFKIKNKKYRNL